MQHARIVYSSTRSKYNDQYFVNVIEVMLTKAITIDYALFNLDEWLMWSFVQTVLELRGMLFDVNASVCMQVSLV